MRYYLKTTDPQYLEAFREIKGMAGARFRFFKQKAQEWGFDEIGLEDFGSPTSFFKLQQNGQGGLKKGPFIEGFKGGYLHHQEGNAYFRYSFHGRNKTATVLMRELENAPALPLELTGDQHHFRKNIATAFCLRFGLPTYSFDSSRVELAMVYLLRSGVLVCSLPYNTRNDYEAVPAVIPEQFEEITERAWATEIDKHNASVKEVANG